MIKTWQQRCEKHPDHEGIVSEQMIRDRMQEEIDELRQALTQPQREWVGLNSFDRTLLRNTYAPLKTLHHIKETDTDIVAEVINDWETFFTAIEQSLKDKNT